MSRAPETVVIDNRPLSRVAWLKGLVGHFDVLRVMARNDFQVRYKRASFGVAWAVLLPLIQSLVLAVVFSSVIRVSRGENYGLYVVSGVMPWSYFNMTLLASATAIVDGANLTDKVWFPRAMLSIVPVAANLITLAITMVLLAMLAPIMGGALSFKILLLIPACFLIFLFTMSLGLVLSAMHVYFRDIRFIVTALMLVWFYGTPIIYPPDLLGDSVLRMAVDLNPMTGILAVFRLATVGSFDGWELPVITALASSVVMLVVAVELHRRRDRLFVDLL